MQTPGEEVQAPPPGPSQTEALSRWLFLEEPLFVALLQREQLLSAGGGSISSLDGPRGRGWSAGPPEGKLTDAKSALEKGAFNVLLRIHEALVAAFN